MGCQRRLPGHGLERAAVALVEGVGAARLDIEHTKEPALEDERTGELGAHVMSAGNISVPGGDIGDVDGTPLACRGSGDGRAVEWQAQRVDIVPVAGHRGDVEVFSLLVEEEDGANRIAEALAEGLHERLKGAREGFLARENGGHVRG